MRTGLTFLRTKSHVVSTILNTCGCPSITAMASVTLEAPTTSEQAQSRSYGSSRADFLKVYQILRDGLLEDETVERQPAFAKQHLKKALDYNVPGGKLNRGMAVADVLRAVRSEQGLTEEDIFDANVLGWCIEWLQAFFLVADDIMDKSVTRRGQPCWYKRPDVGLMACNDYILLDTCLYRILRRYFSKSSHYTQLLDLFHEEIDVQTTHQTAVGQLLDTLTAPIGTVDLNKYSLSNYMGIVTFKTAYYSFYLPVACGLILGGRGDESNLQLAQGICLQMGQYFQIQDDYLDCYGAPEVIGKIGTDIQDNKCSWLVVQALERASSSQRAVIEENYGKEDKPAVESIKELYRELKLEEAFQRYEQDSYEKINSAISSQKQLPEGVFSLLLKKIYKRSK